MADPAYMKSFQPEEDAPKPAALPSYMKSFQPDTRPDPDVIAHAAADQTQPQAAKTLDIADKTGMAPQYLARNFDVAAAAHDKQTFADQLRYSSVLSAWAAQSPQNAALAKPDAERLARTEGWFSGWPSALVAGFRDVIGAEAMRQKTLPDSAGFLSRGWAGPWLASKALGLEASTREYDNTEHPYPQQVIRALPQIAFYAAAEFYGGLAGTASMLYSQNKGVLARQIELAQPVEADKRLSPEEIDKYATTGSAVSAATLTVLLGPLLRSLPGMKSELQAVSSNVMAKAASTTVGQAAIRSLLAYGQHTFMGALGMTLQHSINSATAQKAAGEDVDLTQLSRDSVPTFLKVLPVAATLSAYGPTRDFLAERGRLTAAPLERAKLDAMIEDARQMQMAKTAPERLADLFGVMGRNAKVFIDHVAAGKMRGLQAADVAAAMAAKDAVAVPLGDYLTKHADQHEAVKDDVKLTADGVTMNEARARDKELRKALPPDVAEVLLGKQTPDEVLNFEQPKETEEAPPAAPKTDKVAETIVLHRGSREKDPSQPGVAGARFMSPDRAVAEAYGEGGKVSTETMNFQNVLKADSFDAVKEKLGFKVDPDEVRTADAELGNLEAVLNKARELGHDAISFKSAKGTEYVDLMNWLHEMVNQYGGTVKEWQDRLTPEFIGALKEEGSKGAISPEEHASRIVEAMQNSDIDPARFERLAKKSTQYIQEAAEKARSGSAAGAKASSAADVAVLQTHELARDVNLAKAAKATEVRAEMDKIETDLTKAAQNDKLRALLNKAGAPLLNLFDALTERTASPNSVFQRKGFMAAHQEAVEGGAESFSADATQHADARREGALDEAKQWFEDAARPFPANEQVVQQYLSNPRPLGQLRPAEVRTLADFVRQLAKTAREENTARRKDAEATVEEAAAEISGELRQNPSKGLPAMSGIPHSWMDDRLRDANAANAVMLRPKNNLRQKSIAAMKWIFDPVGVDAVYERDGYMRGVGVKYKEAFKAMPDEIAERRYESYDLSDKLPTDHLKLEPLTNVPRKWIWKMAQHRMSQGNMERITSTTGWDSEVIDRILFDDPKTKLTVPEWDYLQSIADVKETVWQMKKAHMEKFYGMAPPRTAGVPFRVELPDGTFKDYKGGYEPLKRDARPGVAPQPEPTKGIAQYWGKDFQAPSMPGSNKERVENSHYLVNMDWDSGPNVLAKELHWLAFDQPVRSVARLLNDQGLAADMNQYLGEGRAAIVRGWLKSSATQQAQSVPEGMEIVGKTFGWQRRLQLMGIVGGSGRLAVAQLSHPFGLMLGGKVNPIHGLPAFLSTFKPMTMADGEVRLFPNWNDALDYGKEVQHRADNAYRALREGSEQSGQTSRPGPLGALVTAAKQTAGLYLHAVDRLTTSWAWTAFHNEAVAKGAEPFSEEATRYADGLTQDVMPVHDIETAAPILTNRQIGGFLVMHGFKNTLYQFRQDALAASARDFHLSETPGEYGVSVAKTAGRVALQAAMYGGFAVMGKLALGYAQQSDESKGQWLARDFIAGQTVDLPFIGGLAEPLAKYMTGGHVTRHDLTTYGNPGMAAVNKIYDMLGSLVTEGREDYKKVFDALETLLFLGGVPSRPTRVTAEHFYETLMGEGYDNAESSGLDGVGRFVYTEKQWESIKRSLTPDED